SQSGSLPSFTNTGLISGGAGDSVKISSGAFNCDGGSISGGTLSLSSTAVTSTQSFSTATAGLSLASSTCGGTTTLTIASGTTIQSAVGTLVLRTLALELNHQGTLTLNRSLTLARASAAHTNSGTIDLVSGNLSINQSGTSPSFTNTAGGTITIATGDSLKVSSGALNLNGGTISGG